MLGYLPPTQTFKTELFPCQFPQKLFGMEEKINSKLNWFDHAVNLWFFGKLT